MVEEPRPARSQAPPDSPATSLAVVEDQGRAGQGEGGQGQEAEAASPPAAGVLARGRGAVRVGNVPGRQVLVRIHLLVNNCAIVLARALPHHRLLESPCRRRRDEKDGAFLE